MITFAKAQAASFVASATDYLVTLLCVEWLGFWYFSGSATGTIVGGLIYFSVVRRWVFRSIDSDRGLQLFNYSLVWLGYLFLITNGVLLFTHYLGVNYLISKLMISLVLALFYNYPIQRKFVFSKSKSL